ncbi:hypothetical protein [Halobaculum sp. P14]|uniref:hypothetical protein n=1 Tax=Halobaculum sp. P14 TaxID=3421638 RepID=UPI003EB71687
MSAPDGAACPGCGRRISGIQANGPHTHTASPCGCGIDAATLTAAGQFEPQYTDALSAHGVTDGGPGQSQLEYESVAARVGELLKAGDVDAALDTLRESKNVIVYVTDDEGVHTFEYDDSEDEITFFVRGTVGCEAVDTRAALEVVTDRLDSLDVEVIEYVRSTNTVSYGVDA